MQILSRLGEIFADKVRRWLPDSFVFAILLTIGAYLLALGLTENGPFALIKHWYKGFYLLLEFAMQMILILVTGYALAISPPARRLIDLIAIRIKSPLQVYTMVVLVGSLFSIISWGWIVLTAILARELALRVKRVDYRLIAACAYISFLPWHGGLSGSIPLVLNTPENFLIKAGVMDSTIPTSQTLLSTLNIVVTLLLLITIPLIIILIRPPQEKVVVYEDLKGEDTPVEPDIPQEVEAMRLKVRNFSDIVNDSRIVQAILVFMGLIYGIWYFYTRGFDINLNIMIFIFLILGMLCHGTPIRYTVAMRRACGNVSGIVLQFPFYAGIMGIFMYSGLAPFIANWIAGFATQFTYPFVAFFIGSVVNIFIPSGGGEWAVIGQTIVEAANRLGVPIARAAMAVAYGDTCTNLIQPFWTLAFLPIVGRGVNIAARDFMGYTALVCIYSFLLFGLCVTFLPL